MDTQARERTPHSAPVPENSELESKAKSEMLSNSPSFGISPATAELESKIVR